MASDLEKIGLEALMLMDQWSKGVSQYTADLQKMEDETEKTAKQTAKDTEKMARQQERALQQVGLAFSAAGAAAGVLLTSIAMTASRTEELGVILDVTATNARRMAEANGDYATAAALSADAVNGQVAAVKELGITTQVASQLVAQMIRYNLDWQKATDLARLAQDAATFAAQDSSQALQGLIHGITTLNPRVLRTYGILVNLDQEYQKWAEANNRVSTSITSTEKQAIALNAALAQAPNIAGAYEAAMDTASKQLRSLSRDTTEVAEAFGEHLTPALNAGVGALRDVLKWMRDLPDPIQSTAVQLGVAAAALSSFLGAAALLIPKVISLAGAIKNLALVQNLAAAGMLGPAGLVAGLVAAGAALAVYARNVENARREEAAGIQDASDSYAQYLELLDDAELGSYALSESLWEVANSANAAAEGLDALALTEAFRELQSGFGFDVTGIEWLDDLLESLPRLTADMEQLSEVTLAKADSFSEAQLAVMSDVDAMEQLGKMQGYTGDTLDEFVKVMTEAATIIKATRDAAEGTGHSMIGLGGAIGDVTQEARQVVVSLAAVNVVMGDLEGATEESAEALRDYYKALDEFDQRAGDAVEDAAERMVEAEDDAAERREKARQDLLDAQKDLEQDHAKAVEDIQEQIADVDADLKADLLKAEEEYQQDRAELAQEHQDEIADAERDLAESIEDAQIELARDLEDLERDHNATIESLREKHLASLEALQREYGEKRTAILEKYAQEEAAIEAKYRGDQEEQSVDDQREALQAELRALEWAVGIRARRRRDAIQDELEDLKQQELDALEERKGEELDELQQALEAEQAEREAAYQTQLSEEQAAYEERQEEKQRQYQRDLEDLTKALEREKAEIERRYQERLASLAQQLQEEKQRLDEAAQEARARLQEQLADERESYTERRQELQAHYREQIAEIKSSLAEEKEQIREGLADELREIIENLGEQSEAFRDAYSQQLEDLDNYLADRLERERRYQRELENLYGIDSPSKWMTEFGKSMTAGLDIGLGPSFATSLGDALGAFQTSLGSLGPAAIQPAAMPVPVAQPSVGSSESYSFDFQANYANQQSEASLRDDVNLIMMQMRSMRRGRR